MDFLALCVCGVSRCSQSLSRYNEGGFGWQYRPYCLRNCGLSPQRVRDGSTGLVLVLVLVLVLALPPPPPLLGTPGLLWDVAEERSWIRACPPAAAGWCAEAVRAALLLAGFIDERFRQMRKVLL